MPGELKNAFIGRTERPSEDEVRAVLGETAGLWQDFVDWLAEKHNVREQEWKAVYPAKYGWSARLKLKGRTIVYLGPREGSFVASFVLGDRAVAAAKKARGLSKEALSALAEAPKYAEGTGVRLEVSEPADLAAVRKLAEIKLAN